MTPNLLALTGQIVASYVEHNEVETAAVPEMVRAVYRTLAATGASAKSPSPPQKPAVPIRRSVFPDFIVCLEDGKKLKMLKRHPQAGYGMTPDDYRTKWGLPPNYPMVAPNYASKQSDLSKGIGLGRKSVAASVESILLTKPIEPTATQLPARRARGSKG